ncbi:MULTISPECIES: hypothetical protein [unclassified Helicobacter]|nr:MULTISPECIES: hypothetical protein [unclassified Helicobacter]
MRENLDSAFYASDEANIKRAKRHQSPNKNNNTTTKETPCFP